MRQKTVWIHGSIQQVEGRNYIECTHARSIQHENYQKGIAPSPLPAHVAIATWSCMVSFNGLSQYNLRNRGGFYILPPYKRYSLQGGVRRQCLG